MKAHIIEPQSRHIDGQMEPEILPYILVETKQNKTSTVAEVRGFIADILDTVLERYYNQGSTIEEAIESIKQDFAIDELPAPAKKARNVRDLYEELVDAFEKAFDKKFAGADPRAVDMTLRMIYLSMIDKYRISHIDDMQYLRDKVGLYGYAQQDPLVIYKKEAFEKFEQLMFNIKQETIAIIFRTDFTGGQGQTIIRTEEQENHIMLDRLQEASQDIPEFTPYAQRQPQQMPQNRQQAKQMQYAQAFKDDDGVEVVEVKQKQSPVQNTEKKYGRNDLVTVISPAGKEEEMKYKKAEELLAQGWRLK